MKFTIPKNAQVDTFKQHCQPPKYPLYYMKDIDVKGQWYSQDKCLGTTLQNDLSFYLSRVGIPAKLNFCKISRKKSNKKDVTIQTNKPWIGIKYIC